MNQKENALIRIEGNILTFNSTVLQLSNISDFEIKPKPKKKYPLWLLILFIVGILLIFLLVYFKNEYKHEYNYDDILKKITVYALIFIGASVFVFVVITIMNLHRGKYLIIIMNSGSYFLFSCKDEYFLHKAADEIAKRIDNAGSSVINFKNCNINSSQIGTENSQFVGGNK